MPSKRYAVGDVVSDRGRPLFNFYLDNQTIAIIDPKSRVVLAIITRRQMHSLILKGLGMIPTEVREIADLLVADGYDDDEACAIAWVLYNAGYRKTDEN